MPEAYVKTLRHADFVTSDVSCVAGVWNRVGAYVVPAGVMLQVGRAFDGWCAIIPKDTAGNRWEGKVRLVAANPEETKKIVVLELHTSEIGSATDKAQKRAVPLTLPVIRSDSKLILEIMPDANATLDYGLSTILLDCTVYIVQ